MPVLLIAKGRPEPLKMARARIVSAVESQDHRHRLAASESAIYNVANAESQEIKRHL